MNTTGLIAKKIGMTRMVGENGQLLPVTLLQVAPQKVTKILTTERDGYQGIQVGYFNKREKRLAKPDIARLRKVNVAENFTRFKEFRLDEMPEGLELGSELAAGLFEGVTAVDVTGLTKGRGFQGSTKRWNYKTGRRTHGSHFHRKTGSLGACTTPGRVMKGKRMPGHMGQSQRTIQNLKVMDLDTENNVIAIHGSVPGNRESYLVLKPSIKAKAPKADK